MQAPLALAGHVAQSSMREERKEDEEGPAGRSEIRDDGFVSATEMSEEEEALDVSATSRSSSNTNGGDNGDPDYAGSMGRTTRYNDGRRRNSTPRAELNMVDAGNAEDEGRNASPRPPDRRDDRGGGGHRSLRDPHVASQSAYAAHVQASQQQTPDPTAVVWRRLNAALVEEARQFGVDGAVDLLSEIDADGRAVSQNFNQVVSLLAADGRLEDGLSLALEAGKREFANIITFRPLMKLCCSSGDGRSAKRVWRAMVECGVDGDMFLYAEFMGALVRSQDLVAAERVLDSLHESGRRPHVVLYNTLLKGHAKQANVRQAFDVLDRLVSAGVNPDETTFNTILNTCVRAKDMEGLNNAMSLMHDHRVKPGVPTFNTLLKLYARAGKFEDALEIFHEMQETVEPSIVTFNTLIDGCAHRGDMEQAASFFDEMIERGMEPDICTMTSLLKGFGRSNNPKRAVELYEAMKDGGYRIEERTRYAVINACLRGNDRENAKRLMHEMLAANLRIRVRTWVWLLETDIWNDDEDGAITTLRELTAHGCVLDAACKSSILRESREHGGFLQFQRELKATRSVHNADRRRRD